MNLDEIKHSLTSLRGKNKLTTTASEHLSVSALIVEYHCAITLQKDSVTPSLATYISAGGKFEEGSVMHARVKMAALLSEIDEFSQDGQRLHDLCASFDELFDSRLTNSSIDNREVIYKIFHRLSFELKIQSCLAHLREVLNKDLNVFSSDLLPFLKALESFEINAITMSEHPYGAILAQLGILRETVKKFAPEYGRSQISASLIRPTQVRTGDLIISITKATNDFLEAHDFDEFYKLMRSFIRYAQGVLFGSPILLEFFRGCPEAVATLDKLDRSQLPNNNSSEENTNSASNVISAFKKNQNTPSKKRTAAEASSSGTPSSIRQISRDVTSTPKRQKQTDEKNVKLVKIIENGEQAGTSSSSSSSTKKQKSAARTSTASSQSSPGHVRVKFSIEEENFLKDGVAKYGKGNWASILHDPTFKFHEKRTTVNLKDKWRTMEKQQKVPTTPSAAAVAAAAAAAAAATLSGNTSATV